MKLDAILETTILAHYKDGQIGPGSTLLFQAFRGKLTKFFRCHLRYTPGSETHAEDLAQETMLRVHQALLSDRRQADPILSLPSFTTVCAQRALADWWSRHPPEILLNSSSQWLEDSADDDRYGQSPLHSTFISPDEALEEKRRRDAVEDCLEKLPNPRHRACLDGWLLGLPLRELAQRHGYRDTNGSTTAKDTAKRLLTRCLEALGFAVEFE